jgi:hypothetical protein
MLLKWSLVSRNNALNPPLFPVEVEGPTESGCEEVLDVGTVGFGVKLVLTVAERLDLLGTNDRRDCLWDSADSGVLTVESASVELVAKK